MFYQQENNLFTNELFEGHDIVPTKVSYIHNIM